MVWNRGISYGLFQQHEDWGRYGLVLLSVAAAIGMGVWLARARTIVLALALGLLIGGALGNALDRFLYGAVADFVLLYWIPFFPYVFNVADLAIVAGVALLLYDSSSSSRGHARVRNRVPRQRIATRWPDAPQIGLLAEAWRRKGRTIRECDTWLLLPFVHLRLPSRASAQSSALPCPWHRPRTRPAYSTA